jgi:protein translocase SecG subunit
MNIVIGILTALSVLVGIFLITVVVMQTPKSEGFGGVSNAQTSNFRGKAGYDDMLSGYTRIIAITWAVLAFLLAVFSEIAGRNA